MANPIGEAFITLRPDLSKFQGEAGKALSGQLSGLGGKFSQLGQGFTIGVTAPIVAGFVLASKASLDFESAFAGVVSKVQGTPEQLKAIGEGAREMSKELPFSATAILEVAKNAGQLGVKTDDILKFTRVVLQMAQTTNLTAEEAGAAMAKIANILGLGGDSFDRLGSTILALGNIGASTEKDIVEMALRIAGAGKVVGLSAPQVLAFANALSTVGLDAESGGTAISRAFVEMNNAVAGLQPTEEQLRAIGTAQLAVRDSSDTLASSQRGVRDAVEAVGTAYIGVEQANRTIRNANESLSDAYKALARAQRDQTQASFDARRESLSVAQAQQHLAEVQSKSGSALVLEQRESSLAIAEAQQRLADAQKAGSKEIAEAQRRLNDVRAQGKPSAAALRDAEKALNDARAKDHSLEIARAQQTLASAQQRGFELDVRQKGSSLEVQAAQLTLAEAVNRVGTAQETQADKVLAAQRNVRNSTEGVKDANRGYVDSQRNVRNALEGVSDAEKARTKAEEALKANQLKLNELTDGSTGKLKLFADVAGVSAQEFAELFKKDAAGAMVLFVNGLNRVQKEGGNVFTTLDKLGLGEIRVRDSLLRLAGGQGILEENLKTAMQAWIDNTELERQAAIQNETTAAKLQKFRNVLVDIAITLGDKVVPRVLELAENFAPLVGVAEAAADAFAGLPAPIQTGIIVFAGLLAVVGPVLVGLGILAGSLSAIIAIAPAVGIAFTVMTGPVGLTVLAIAALVAGIVIAIKHWDEIKSVASGAAVAIRDVVVGAFNAVLGFLSKNWREVGTLISGPFLPIVLLATDAFGIRTALVGAFASVVKWVMDNWAEIATLLSGPFAPVVALATDAFGIRTAAIDAFRNAGTWLYRAGVAVLNGFLGGLADKWQDVKDFFGSITDQIPRLKGPPGVDAKILEPSGRMVMAGFQRGLEKGWAPIPQMLQGMTSDLGSEMLPGTGGVLAAIGSSPGAGGLMGRSSGGGGGDSRMAAIAGKDDRMMIEVNNYGPIQTRGQSSKTGLSNLGWGIAGELQRRGVYPR